MPGYNCKCGKPNATKVVCPNCGAVGCATCLGPVAAAGKCRKCVRASDGYKAFVEDHK